VTRMKRSDGPNSTATAILMCTTPSLPDKPGTTASRLVWCARVVAIPDPADKQERSLSNSSDVFAPSTHSGPHSAAPMALNGSNFGAGSALDAYEYDEKTAPALPPLPGQAQPQSPYDAEEDYANMPPAVQMQPAPTVPAYSGYDSEEEGRPPMPHAHWQDGQMDMVQGGAPVTYYHHGH